MYTKVADCRCKTFDVPHSFMTLSLMNTKSTQVSNVHKVDDEGKMLIIVVKPFMSLTLP